MGINYEASNDHANNEILCLSQQISDEAQILLNADYNINSIPSENISSSLDDEITEVKTFHNNNLYFHNNESNNSKKNYRRKHKFDVASGKLNELVLKNAFDFYPKKIKI